MSNVSLEICAGSILDIETVKDLAIDRIELNTAIELGGLTADAQTLARAKQLTNVPIVCMVRCRGGDFNYTTEEFEVMLDQGKNLLEHGADGLVIGFIDYNHQVKLDWVKAFRKLTEGKQLVFHKAFDYIENQQEAIEQLIEIGVDRILLMGNYDYQTNLTNIAKLQEKYGNYIELQPGGGVDNKNILDILEKTGCNNIHGTFKKVVQYDTNEQGIFVDKKKVIEIINLLEK